MVQGMADEHLTSHGSEVFERLKRGFTVLELLIAIGCIAMLIALLLPAIMAAREAARRTTCVNHLRQVGIAFQSHHDQIGCLPAAWQLAGSDKRFAYGWATRVLPFLEKETLAKRFDYNARPTFAMEEVTHSSFICPSDILEPVFDLWSEPSGNEAHGAMAAAPSEDVSAEPIMQLPSSSYQGVFGTAEADEAYEPFALADASFGEGSVVHNRKVRFRDLERGLSNTLLIGERVMAMVPSTWLGVDLRGEDSTCRLVGSAITHPNCTPCDECEFGSRHAGGAQFAWADGHVSLVSDDVDSAAYQQMSLRDSQ
jgi:prepilin-type processing-associated H-X9-DG protein